MAIWLWLWKLTRSFSEEKVFASIQKFPQYVQAMKMIRSPQIKKVLRDAHTALKPYTTTGYTIGHGFVDHGTKPVGFKLRIEEFTRHKDLKCGTYVAANTDVAGVRLYMVWQRSTVIPIEIAVNSEGKTFYLLTSRVSDDEYEYSDTTSVAKTAYSSLARLLVALNDDLEHTCGNPESFLHAVSLKDARGPAVYWNAE